MLRWKTTPKTAQHEKLYRRRPAGRDLRPDPGRGFSVHPVRPQRREDRDPARYADAEGEFPANLERFVNAARNRLALPVLITPLARRRYGDIAQATHAAYAEAVRKTAARLGVPLVDLYEASTKAIRRRGEGSAEWFLHVPPGKYPHFPQGLADDTHLSCAGAAAFAGLVARGLFALGGPYAALLLEEYAQTLSEA
jgi:lysophospholipase L1-like esterase